MLAKNSPFNHNQRLQAKANKELTSNGQALIYPEMSRDGGSNAAACLSIRLKIGEARVLVGYFASVHTIPNMLLEYLNHTCIVGNSF